MAIRLLEPRALGLDKFESTIERFAEALLLLGYNALDAGGLRIQFVVGFTHSLANTLANLC